MAEVRTWPCEVGRELVGRRVPEWETDEKTGRKRCSACKSCYIEDEWTGGEWEYCPVCGALMKEKA